MVILPFPMAFKQPNIRDLPNPAAVHAAVKDMRSRYSERVCMAPTNDCEGSIIAAHTLSVGKMLTPISRDGHVYALKPDCYAANFNEVLSIGLCGVRKTSTFNGFCAKHDRELFLPIENKPFTASTEQFFLHAYRAICKECYGKPRQAQQADRIPEIRQNIHNQASATVTSDELLYMAASKVGATDVHLLKMKMDKLLIGKDFSKLRTTFIKFKKMPSIVCNFVYMPDMDFDDRELQDFTAPPGSMELLFVTVSPNEDGGGYLLLSHLGNRKATNPCRRLIDSLLAQSDISSAVATLIITRCENFAISPDWFGSLNSYQQRTIQEACYVGLPPIPGVTPIPTLQKIKIQVQDWVPEKPTYR